MSILAKSRGEITYKDLTGIHKWFLIVLVSLGSSLIYTPLYLKNVFYDPLMQGLGATNTDLGAMVSLYGIAAMICYLPSGIVADKFRMRTLSWVGFIASAVVVYYYATLPSIFMCYVVFGVMGVTTILIWWGTRFKLVRLCCEEDEYPARIGVSYSIYGVAGLVIGLVNTAVFALVPIPAQGVQLVLFWLATAMVVLGVLSYILIPDFKGEINKDSKLFSLADAVEAIKTPGVIWACLAYFCVYAFYQGASYTTPYLTALGTDANLTNIVSLVRTYGIALVAGPVLGFLAARFKSTKAIAACFGLSIVVFVVLMMLPVDNSVSLIAVCLVLLIGFVTYGAFSIGSSPLSELGIPMRIFGTAAGLLSVIGFMPDVFIHTWYGSMIDASGTAAFNMIFIIEALIAAVGILCLVMCMRTVKKHLASKSEQQSEN